MRPPIWYGTVLKGKIKLDNKPRFLEYLNGFEGKRVEMVLKDYDGASKSDRGYYFAEIVPAFAEHMGYPPEEKDDVHKIIKEFMGVITTRGFKGSDWKEYVAGCRRKADSLGIITRDKKHIDMEVEP